MKDVPKSLMLQYMKSFLFITQAQEPIACFSENMSYAINKKLYHWLNHNSPNPLTLKLQLVKKYSVLH